MKKIAFVMVLLALSVSMFGQKKNKKEAPVDNSYQTVDVNNEACICYDTTYHKYDMICFVVESGNVTSTKQVTLGVEMDDIAQAIVASEGAYGISHATVCDVMKYFILQKQMPVKGFAVAVEYCTDYSMQLKVSFMNYGLDNLPITFAIEDPTAKIKLKEAAGFSAGEILHTNDFAKIAALIRNKTIRNDKETDFFLCITKQNVQDDNNGNAKGKKNDVKKDENKKDNADKGKGNDKGKKKGKRK